MGKTALAVNWAHQVADRFPDGQLYVNLRGFDPGGAAMTAGEALRGFLEALGVTPQRIPGDLDAQASLYRSMLYGRWMSSTVEQAYLHSTFGAIFAHQGSHKEAVAHYRQAYDCYQAADHRTGQAEALKGIGGCYGQQGRYGKATSLVFDAMTIYRELGDLNGEGDCWVRLGEFHHPLGEHEQALACYGWAVVVWRGLGNRAGEALTLESLGDSALAARDCGQTREAWEKALTMLTELGLPAADSVRRKLHRLREPETAQLPDLAYR